MTSKMLALALCICAFARFAQAEGDKTAFELVKDGNKYVGEQSKDKIVAIHSDKSSVTMAPTVWIIGYYDPDTAFKVVEVKFVSGQEMSANRPPRAPWDMAAGSKIMANEKLKIDSNQALKIATDQQALSHLTLKASQLWLNSSDDGPVWKVRLWAASVSKPDKQVDIGDTIISAETGSIIKSSLRPDRVD